MSNNVIVKEFIREEKKKERENEQINYKNEESQVNYSPDLILLYSIILTLACQTFIHE